MVQRGEDLVAATLGLKKFQIPEPLPRGNEGSKQRPFRVHPDELIAKIPLGR
jgi:hypothetical protein